jgi:ArsR family transcriptional regulator
VKLRVASVRTRPAMHGAPLATLVPVMTEPKPTQLVRPLPVLRPRGPLAEQRVVAETRNLTVEAFRALADPVRLELLARVAAYGPICVCHLEEQLPYSQSRISKHLGTLRRAGLVSARRQGAWVYYQTSEDMLAVCREFLEQLGASLRTPHETDLCADPD